MYEYLSGKLTSLTPATAVIDCGGVGYLTEITLNTYSAIQEKQEVRLWIHEVIREDAYLLYGFYTEAEREMFRLLIGVNGVGAATARMMLSSLSVKELGDAIASQDAKMVQRVKGVGAKTAQRIVLELQDKVGDTAMGAGLPQASAAMAGAASVKKEEAVSALVMLGFPKTAAEKVVMALDNSMTVEEMIKEGLRRI
jgi:Holliday junction DNA helicase RuvA